MTFFSHLWRGSFYINMSSKIFLLMKRSHSHHKHFSQGAENLRTSERVQGRCSARVDQGEIDMKIARVVCIIGLCLLLAGCPTHYKKGLTLIEKGQTEQAIAELLVALEDDPNNGDIYYQLGMLYFQQEEYPRAIEFFQKIVDQFPAHPSLDSTYYHLGLAHFRLGEYKPASRNFSLLAISFPENPYAEPVQFYQGEIYWFQNEFGKTIGVLNDFLRRFPTSEFAPAISFRLAACHYRIGNYAEAIAAYKNFLSAAGNWASPPSHLSAVPALEEQAYADIGYSYAAQEEYGSAIGYFRDVLTKFPQSSRIPELLYQLGNLYELTNSEQQAIDAFRKLVADAPGSEYADDALFRLGTAYYQGEQYQQALDAYTQLCKAYPQSPNLQCAQMMSGHCYFMLEQPEQALAQYEQAFRQKPTTVQLGETELVLEDDEETSALHSQAALRAAISAYKMDDYSKAQAFIAMIPPQQHSAEVVFWSGEIAYRMQRFDDAQRDFSKVIAETQELNLLQQAHTGLVKIL